MVSPTKAASACKWIINDHNQSQWPQLYVGGNSCLRIRTVWCRMVYHKLWRASIGLATNFSLSGTRKLEASDRCQWEIDLLPQLKNRSDMLGPCLTLGSGPNLGWVWHRWQVTQVRHHHFFCGLLMEWESLKKKVKAKPSSTMLSKLSGGSERLGSSR